MPQIDFYYRVSDPTQFACRLAARVLKAGQRLFVLLPDEAALAVFDAALWTFEPTGFVPHVRATDPLAADTPVVFDTTMPAGDLAGRALLNLSLGIPPAFDRFDRLLELVGCAPADLDAARDVARHYKQAGLAVVFHDMAGR